MPSASEVANPKNNVNLQTAKMVELISEIGPDIPEISRRLDQFKESVRYRYKEKVLRRGLAIQAAVDYGRLGLQHLEMIVEFPDEIKTYAQPMLIAMSDLCYVAGFEKLYPRGNYVVGANVPKEFVNSYVNFMLTLQDKGVFSSVDIHQFEWFRRVPMHVEFYDFDAGRWDFDWSARPTVPRKVVAYAPPQRVEFDYMDLLILKELYIDATRPLTEIARKLNENYKKMAWHYGSHVCGLGLIDGYTLRWPGTKYDSDSDRVRQRQHKYFWIDLIVENLSEVERMGLMSKAHLLPFAWAEACGKDYFVQFAIPLEFYTEAMQYFEETLSPFKDRVNFLLMDQTSALDFTMSYKLYDQESHAWTLNVPELEKRFDELIVKIKGGRG